MKNKLEPKKTRAVILIAVGFLILVIPQSPLYPQFSTTIPVELIYTLSAILIIVGVVVAKYG